MNPSDRLSHDRPADAVTLAFDAGVVQFELGVVSPHRSYAAAVASTAYRAAAGVRQAG